MGCDIHLHTEVKINGVWHHYGAPSVDRNYALFAKMANVRNYCDIEPIAEPRGIPADASELTKHDCERWGTDGHSHSYLNATEIAELVAYAESQGWKDRRLNSLGFWEPAQFGYLFGNDWSGFVKYPDQHTDGLEDVRFVFWFDN